MTAQKNTRELTAERLRDLLDYDPLTGVFTNRTLRGWRAKAGDIAGCFSGRGYRRICVDGQFVYEHRLAWLHVFGCWPTELDHVDGNKSNNRIANLRDVTTSVNHQNRRRANSSTTSGLLGVAVNRKSKKNPWRAAITLERQYIYLGCFPTAELAHAAYLEAKRRLHPGSTL